MTTAISVDGLSKMYRLGVLGTGTLAHDLNRVWAKVRGKPDPALNIGMENDREQAGGDYVWALRDISFDVPEGEILGIIGRNGAGKSTLLKILSRITAPTKGTIKMRGRVASLLEVGTGFHPELTGRENVFLNGAILGMTRPEVAKRLDEIVAFSGCEKYIDTPAKRYSSGMKVRLGFSVAAHLECEILIVDEVLAVGDAEFQRKCIGKMKEVGATGRTILFVSHNMNSVTSICRKALIVSQGKTSQIMRPEDAVEQYLKMRTNSTTELAERTDRGGNGLVKFVYLSINSEPSTSATLLRSGDDAEIDLWLKSNSSSESSADFTIAVYTAQGHRVSSIRSTLHDFELRLSPNQTRQVRINVQLPNLAPGDYYLNLFAESEGESCDWVEKAASFSIIPQEHQRVDRRIRVGEVICQTTFSDISKNSS